MPLELIDYVMLGIWALIIVSMLILEFMTADFVSLWFIIGALAAGISVFFGAPIWLQIVIFAVVSVVCILATRPLAKKINSKDNVATNADRLLHKIAIVTKDIKKDEKGEVKIEHNYWPAVSLNDEFAVGDKVVVQAIVGNKLQVAKIEEIEI